MKLKLRERKLDECRTTDVSEAFYLGEKLIG
jgi:hypothetical protein